MKIEEIHKALNKNSKGFCEISLKDRVLLCSDTDPRVALLYNPNEKCPYAVVHVIEDYNIRRKIDQNHICSSAAEAVTIYMSRLSAIVGAP